MERSRQAGSAREKLMDAAEVVIAEKGMEVSMREIAVAAGQRNNSAVGYHFGGRDELIAAVIDRRMEDLEQRRMTMLADLGDLAHPARVRDLLDVIVVPALSTPYEAQATHYARFVQRVQTHSAIATDILDDPGRPAMRIVVRGLADLLPPLPKPLERRRMMAMATCMFGFMAEYEHRGELSTPAGRRDCARELCLVLEAVLAAPFASLAQNSDSSDRLK